LSKLCRLKPIFPAVVAHGKARKTGNLLLLALTASASWFDKLGSFLFPEALPLKTDFSSRSLPWKSDKNRELASERAEDLSLPL